MNRFLPLALNTLEWLVPLVGITRLGARCVVSVLLATIAHLVPVLGCAFAGWDPVTILLAYWIDLTLVIVILLAVLIVYFSVRLLAAKNVISREVLDHFSIIAWWGCEKKAARQLNVITFVLSLWFVLSAVLMYGCMEMLLGIARSHYGVESLTAAFDRLAIGFLPPTGGVSAFLESEAASLSFMMLSSVVSLWSQFFARGGDREERFLYVFMVKPMVQVMVMVLALGTATDRLPALATVSAMALAMALVDQRSELLNHDFGPDGKGDARFKTPHGALLNFGCQLFLFIIGASFFISSVFEKERYDRILSHPVAVKGIIIGARPPDEEGRTIDGGYFWYVDIRYKVGPDSARSFILHNIRVHLFSVSEPTGGTIRVIHEAGNPHNAFADVPEEREKPKIACIRGIIVLVMCIMAWWAVGRFFHP
ncbi:MAG TPA: DUF6498-containing protein [Spirochaetota bacterium]|nr:DUF6498-containing protein [Spirochaetota bacterium]